MLVRTSVCYFHPCRRRLFKDLLVEMKPFAVGNKYSEKFDECPRSHRRAMIINVCGVIDDVLIMKFFVFCSGISFGMLLLQSPKT